MSSAGQTMNWGLLLHARGRATLTLGAATDKRGLNLGALGSHRWDKVVDAQRV
jgi:hypothetical protein